MSRLPDGFADMMKMPFWEALLGRRSRRFHLGAEIPDGVFQYRSRHSPMPLSELEKLLVVAACGGNTSWHHLIHRAERYAPHLSNYAGSAGGRTFPSAAGFHTSQTFFTDDDGVYMLDARDATPFAERDEHGHLDLEQVLESLRASVRKIQDGRLKVPPEVPHVEAHNTWVVNRPGTLLVIPVGDLAQHVLLGLCYLLQNGYSIYDDIHRQAIPGLDEFSDLFDPGRVWPITLLDQVALGEMTVELGTSCYAGALALQTMGLGGWMFNGMDWFSVMGASGDPDVSGLGFEYSFDERWPYPNPTGREGVMQAFCPPRFPDMRAAVDALCDRKFGPGGPFHRDTPGPFVDTPRVRSAAQVHDERFRRCVARQAQYILDAFGKFPATVPSMLVFQYLQSSHLDLEFYDRFYTPGAYLETHARHMERWHPEKASERSSSYR